MEIRNNVAFVTGGARGIGRALCRALHQKGARIAVADLDGDRAAEVARELDGLAFELDVSKEEGILEAVEATEAELGPIGIFVSNAGIGFQDGPGGPASVPDEHWRTTIDVNLMAHVWAARIMVPRMVIRGGGCLVNVASAAGLLSQIGAAAYSAVKHAAVGFAESVAIGHGDDGIQVCVVCPQAVATAMIGIEDETVKPDSEGFSGNALDGILLPSDVADCVIDAIEQGRFMVLPHPQAGTYFMHKAGDYDRWIAGMRKYRRKLAGETL